MTTTGLIVLGFVCAGVRIVHATAQQAKFPMDADEAVTGVMAQRIAHHGQMYTFFTGQTYNGSFEQYLQAALFLVGMPSTALALRSVQIALALLTMLTIHQIARRTVHGYWWPLFAAALFAAGPFWNTYLGTRSYGSYAITELAASVGTLAALAAAGFQRDATRSPSLPQRRLVMWSGVFGFCVGIVVWNGISGLEVLGIAALWLVPGVLRSWRAAITALTCAAIGASPILRWIYTHHRIPLPPGGGAIPSTVGTRFQGLVHEVIPKFLGLTHDASLNRSEAVVVAVLIAIVWLAAVIVRRRGILAVLTLRREPRAAVDLLLLILPAAIVLYLASDFSWFTQSPRYIEVLYPVVAVLIMVLARTIVRTIGRFIPRAHEDLPVTGPRRLGRVITPPLAIAAAAALLMTDSLAFSHAPPAPGSTTDQNIADADRYLGRSGYQNAYAFYWTAPVAQYFAGNLDLHVAAWSIGGEKSGPSRVAVDTASKFAYMASTRSGDTYEGVLRDALLAHRVSFTERRFGGVVVFTGLSPQLRPNELGLP